MAVDDQLIILIYMCPNISCESISQSCLTLCDPTDCNPLGCSVHRILQARILEWVAIPVFLPGESHGWGSLVGCVYGVTQSRTRLKRLGGSSHVLPVLLISERCQHITWVERKAKSLRAKI